MGWRGKAPASHGWLAQLFLVTEHDKHYIDKLVEAAAGNWPVCITISRFKVSLTSDEEQMDSEGKR